MVNLLKLKLELFAFFELTPDLVCLAGKDGFLRKVNKAVIDKLQYTEAELYSKPIASFIHPDDKDLTHKNRTELLGGKVLHNFENRYITKQGETVWLTWTSIYFADSELVLAIAKDLTEKKKLEKEADDNFNRFKSLTTYFKGNIEKDRKYLTYELHEELAQLVFAVKTDVELIAGNKADLPAASKERIEHALTVSKLLIETLQRISFSISPKMLEEFGLNDTLEWLCREFSILNVIPCLLEFDYDEENLTDEIKIDFFRICQEALSNVIRHAMAKKVMISIKIIDEKLQLTIMDDGKGFDVPEQINKPGLISMRERVNSINGKLTIQSVPGKGSSICVEIAK